MTAYTWQGQTYNLAPDWYNLVKNDWGHKEGDTYWDAWIKDVASGALAGQQHYEYGNYSQLKAGEAALKKQQDAQQAQIQGQVGDMQSGLQESYRNRGLSRSGLLSEGMSRIAGAESGALDAMKSRIDADRQRFTQGLNEQWAAERQMEKERSQRKRNKKYGVASQVLGTTGMIGGMALAGPAGAYAGSQLGQLGTGF